MGFRKTSSPKALSLFTPVVYAKLRPLAKDQPLLSQLFPAWIFILLNG
ncbi:hypothetical protein X474_17765 [Dethiosulfatarculus sandiegensis]|uniref:Uncharacterized protein n=1 Tax=Dethiosulfatarculus sandiegensis TaxID=1429043 RepID=A0A0D2JTB2_9BACT|nr:hypothetical protein X474_17765 [Dethiosulfatarculus sandiegensis]